MSTQEQKIEEIASQLKELEVDLNNDDKMRIALSLGCSLDTVKRYLDGKVKILLYGREILKEAQKIVDDKKSAAAKSVAA